VYVPDTHTLSLSVSLTSADGTVCYLAVAAMENRIAVTCFGHPRSHPSPNAFLSDAFVSKFVLLNVSVGIIWDVMVMRAEKDEEAIVAVVCAEVIPVLLLRVFDCHSH
jgi:hypothetical protein